jgi:hypothetical protein
VSKLTVRRLVSRSWSLFGAVVWGLGAALAFLAALQLLLTMVVGGESYAATQSVAFKHEVGISGQVITTTTDPQFLSVPLGATHARIYVEDNPVCYSYGIAEDDEPSPAGGGKWPAGYVSKEENDRPMLQRMQVLSCTGSGAAIVNVYYSRDRRVGD